MSMLLSLCNILLLLSREKYQQTFKVTSLACSVCFQPDCICTARTFPDMLHFPRSCITGWALAVHALLQQTFPFWPQPQLSFSFQPHSLLFPTPRLLLRHFMVLNKLWVLRQGFLQSRRWTWHRSDAHTGAGKGPYLSYFQDKWHLSKVAFKSDLHGRLSAPRCCPGSLQHLDKEQPRDPDVCLVHWPGTTPFAHPHIEKCECRSVVPHCSWMPWHSWRRPELIPISTAQPRLWSTVQPQHRAHITRDAADESSCLFTSFPQLELICCSHTIFKSSCLNQRWWFRSACFVFFPRYIR